MRDRRYTLEDLQAAFRLDGDTLVRTTGPKAGQPAASHVKANGYVDTNFSPAPGVYLMIREHIVKVALRDGAMPDYVDHIDGNRSNNHLSNLRACSRSENMRNMRRKRRKLSLPRGVNRLSNGRFRVYVTKDRKSHCGGTWSTVEEAQQAAITLRIQLHGEFARHD